MKMNLHFRNLEVIMQLENEYAEKRRAAESAALHGRGARKIEALAAPRYA